MRRWSDMHTTRSSTVAIIPVLLVLVLLWIPAAIRSLTTSENARWLAGFLVPALMVLAVHLLFLGMWQRVATWRVRRRVNAALIHGDVQSLRRAAAVTADAEREWPGRDLWVLRKALEITRCRIERAG
jgi:cytochrome c-type biogenesis protein CcmH/NrfG